MKRWAHWSLRRTLLVVLLPGLLAVMGLELAVSWRNALAAANAAFDRSLLGAIKAMDANISTASGGLAVGFGEHARGATAYNPFQSQADIGNLPPLANVEAPQDTQATGADTQREPQP